MAKQNIYDNNAFFENFKDLRSREINFNDCIETPILLSMLPDVQGKKVLDIGCGMEVVKLKEQEIDLPRLDEYIRMHIPAGKKIHDEPLSDAQFFPFQDFDYT